MKRGEVVLVDIPFTDGQGSKIRPALIVQADQYNSRLVDTTVALITGNISRIHDESQCFVDPGSPDGRSSGLHGPSSILCTHLYTVRQSLVKRSIGRLSDVIMEQVEAALKHSLGIS